MAAELAHPAHGRALALTLSPGTALLGCFMAHYLHRAFVYPLVIQLGGKPTPAPVWLMALAFCTYNGLMQVRAHAGAQLHVRRVCSCDLSWTGQAQSSLVAEHFSRMGLFDARCPAAGANGMLSFRLWQPCCAAKAQAWLVHPAVALYRHVLLCCICSVCPMTLKPRNPFGHNQPCPAAQGLYLLYVHPRGRMDALFWVGLALWALGWCINLHSDSVLRSLRALGETGDGLPLAMPCQAA